MSRPLRIAIFGALPEEIAALASLGEEQGLINALGLSWHELVHPSGAQILLGRLGVGKVQAAMRTQLAITLFQPEIILFTGVAGALNPAYAIGDVVVASELVQHDLDVRPLGFELGEVPWSGERFFHADPRLVALALACPVQGHALHRGRILTGDQFIDKSHLAAHRQAFDSLGGDAVEMEGAAVAQVASVHGIPFCVLRTISDRADGQAHIDFPALLPLIAANSCTIISAMLTSLGQHR